MQFIVGASGEILELFCVLFQFRIRTKHVPHNLRRVRSPIKSKGKNRILQEWQDCWRLSATVQNKYVDTVSYTHLNPQVERKILRLQSLVRHNRQAQLYLEQLPDIFRILHHWE